VAIKTKEDKIQIRQFKDGSSHFWCDNTHYHLNASQELIWCAGGQDTIVLREAIESYIKRNKKKFVERSPNIFEREEKEYSKLTFGKFSGLTTMMLVAEDRNYAKWLYTNSTDKKIKEELKELLNLK
jgi:hypothetical protein